MPAALDPSWRASGPFPEGHVALRLPASGAPAFDRPPGAQAGQELDRSAWTLQASHPGARLAIDGDAGTAWGTGKDAQQRGDFFRIGFPRPIEVARVSIAVARGEGFPMRVKLLGEDPLRGWEEIPFDERAAYDRLFARLLHEPLNAAVELELAPPRTLTGLRLRLDETDAFAMPWNMPEVRVYGP